MADRLSDIARGQASSRNLIEQRLKQVMIGPIDECDIGTLVSQSFCGIQPSKPAANDHDFRDRILHEAPRVCETLHKGQMTRKGEERLASALRPAKAGLRRDEFSRLEAGRQDGRSV